MGRERKEPVEKQHQHQNNPVDMGNLIPYMPHQDEDRIIYLAADMTEYSITNVINQIFVLAKRDAKKPIYLLINSYGGEIDSMFALYDAIKLIEAPIHTIALGKVMSAGVLILASGKRGERSIGANCRVMIHSILGGNYGNVFEQQNNMSEMNRLQKLMEKCLAKETGQTKKKIHKIMKKGQDKYLTAEEAKDLGIVDKIIG